MSRTAIAVLSVIVVACLLTASFVLWLNSSVYNSENFSRTTVSVIQKPAVRNAVSAEIVDGIFKQLPENIDIPKQAIEGPARSLVAGVLASPSFRPVLEKLATQFDKAVTANKPTAIRLDTSEIKDAAGPLVKTINAQLDTDIQISDFPDTMVLIEKGAIPSISGWGVFLLWLGPILGVIGAGIVLAMFLLAPREDRPVVLRVLGIVLMVGSVLFMLLISTMRSPLVASVEGGNAKVIAGNMFTAFTSSLATQTWVLVGIGLLMTVAGYVWPRVARPAAPARRRRTTTKKKAA